MGQLVGPLSPSIVGVKPRGIRGRSPSAGSLHIGQGIPGSPQRHAFGWSFQGRSACASQTHPVSPQAEHGMASMLPDQKQPLLLGLDLMLLHRDSRAFFVIRRARFQQISRATL
jgi:hypothetical protein